MTKVIISIIYISKGKLVLANNDDTQNMRQGQVRTFNWILLFITLQVYSHERKNSSGHMEKTKQLTAGRARNNAHYQIEILKCRNIKGFHQFAGCGITASTQNVHLSESLWAHASLATHGQMRVPFIVKWKFMFPCTVVHAMPPCPT